MIAMMGYYDHWYRTPNDSTAIISCQCCEQQTYYSGEYVTYTSTQNQAEPVLSKKHDPMPKESMKPIKEISGRSILRVSKRTNPRAKG